MARTPRPMITSEGFRALEQEWAELHAATPDASPFAHPAWQATWLRHFGERRGDVPAPEPVFLAVRIEEKLHGVVPLDASGPVMRFLGDPNVCDYAGLLAAPGSEAAVASTTLEWLLEDMTPALDAWGLQADSPTALAFEAAADHWGFACDRVVESVAPVADLPADFDSFVAGLSKHNRHELRRKLRHLEADGELTLQTASDAESVQEAVGLLIDMMRDSRRDKDEFLTPVMEAFFRDLAVSMANVGFVRLQTLVQQDRALAALFAFDCHGTRYLYNSGYDPGHSRHAVGLLSKALSLADAISCKMHRFDFLRGSEHYKEQLGGIPREVLTLSMRRS